MKSAIWMGLTAVATLIASPAFSQNEPTWTYIGTTIDDDSFYIDTANVVRDGVYVWFYQKRTRPASYYTVSRLLADCDANLFSILSTADYFPSGRISGLSSIASAPVDALPGTVGWTTLQTICSIYPPQYARPYSLNTFEPLGEGVLVGSPGSRLNVRDRPGMDTSIVRQGTPGDEVVIWDSASVDGQTWYKVAFRGSNATGWVREDLIRFYE